MDEVLEQIDDVGPTGAEPVTASVGIGIKADLLEATQREVARLGASASSYVDELDAAVSREVEQLRCAAARQADMVRATGLSEVARAQAKADTASQELVAEARRDAEDQRAAAAREATEIAESSARRIADLARTALEDAERVRRVAAAAAAEIRDRAEEQAASTLAAAARELETAEDERLSAEGLAGVARSSAAISAAAVVREAEQALAAARSEVVQSDRVAAEVMAGALREAAGALDTARLEVESANELLAEDRRGESLLPATVPQEEPHDDEATPAPKPSVAAPAREAPAAAQVGAGSPPFLVPALSIGRELILRLLVWCGVVTAGWFWVWWIARGHGTWSPGGVAVTVLLAWVFALPLYFYFFVCRLSRPNPSVPVPDLRVAMVVTKAPSEPWPLLRRTLEAMLDQDFQPPYDVWLADEHPSASTESWCADRGVQISTRHGVAEYQRDSWPRRKKSKEGNLAYFYDHYGYDGYDVVVQLDADHVPASGYLGEMVRPFADPRVGYVCAPSICDANVDEGWTVRGRLFREATLHGPVQAGSNGGYAPVCIGSHYAVRTTALRDVGGLGPELAEDYATTLWLQSGGWDGVFNIDAEAHGDGPETLDEMLVQELQWARSLGTILVRWAPGRLRRVPWRARLRLGFALAFYPLQGLALAAGTILPLLGVLLRTSWGETSIIGFYLHLWPYTLVSLLTAAYLRRCRLLRPVKAKLWSWELVLFQLVRWPWTFWGFLQGMYAGSRSRQVDFKVTAKGAPGVKPLRPQSLVPTLALGVLPTSATVLVLHPGEALGLQVLAGVQGVTYLVSATAAVLLHLAANRRRARKLDSKTRWFTWSSGGAALALTAAIVGPVAAALTWRLQTYGLTP